MDHAGRAGDAERRAAADRAARDAERQGGAVERPRAHVAFFHGFLDHSTRYGHVFARLNARGYSVHTYDMRGHGFLIIRFSG